MRLISFRCVVSGRIPHSLCFGLHLSDMRHSRHGNGKSGGLLLVLQLSLFAPTSSLQAAMGSRLSLRKSALLPSTSSLGTCCGRTSCWHQIKMRTSRALEHHLSCMPPLIFKTHCSNDFNQSCWTISTTVFIVWSWTRKTCLIAKNASIDRSTSEACANIATNDKRAGSTIEKMSTINIQKVICLFFAPAYTTVPKRLLPNVRNLE